MNQQFDMVKEMEKSAKIEADRARLKAEQISLVQLLDALQPHDESARYKLLKTACEFFGMRIIE